MSTAIQPETHLRFGLTAEQCDGIAAILNSVVDRIERVAVFGSRAQERHRGNSDLDLVLYGAVTQADCARLSTLFQDSALPFSVDVKSYESIEYAPLRRHIDAVARLWLLRVGSHLTAPAPR